MILDKNEISRRMDQGVREGVAIALARHKKEGQCIAIIRDGKVVRIPPEEIVVPTLEDDSSSEKG